MVSGVAQSLETRNDLRLHLFEARQQRVSVGVMGRAQRKKALKAERARLDACCELIEHPLVLGRLG